MSCVRTIVVWKLTWPLDHDSHYQSCVRTIVVWKRYGRPVVQQGHKLLRENHSGMETYSLPVILIAQEVCCVRTIVVWKPFNGVKKGFDFNVMLRKNHSGMETSQNFRTFQAG